MRILTDGRMQTAAMGTTVRNSQQVRVPSSSEDTSKKETQRKGIILVGCTWELIVVSTTVGMQRSKRLSKKGCSDLAGAQVAM